MINKILLISPPLIVKQSWVEGVSTFPLGLTYIAAVLEKNNFNVEIIDCFIEGYKNRKKIGNQLMRIGMSDDEIIKAIKKKKPDLVGISIPFSCQLTSAFHVNSIIKKVNKDIITVAGGNHVSAAPETIGDSTFDWIVIGEGEYALLDLINAINSDNPHKTIPNVIYAPDLNLSGDINTKIEYIIDLDSLPFPRYRLLPLEKYWRNGPRRVNMFVTRGCPYNCVFCSVHTIMGRKIRYRSIKNIINEIASLKQELKLERIYFEDDNLSWNIEWAKELFKCIIQKDFGLEIYIRNGIRADRVDLELLKLMKMSGVKHIAFAPESGKQETLDKIINKKMKLKDCEKAIRMAKEIGIEKVHCFLVIGFPEENMDDIKQTIQYGHKLKKLGCDSIWVSCATPYPGTRLFENCIKRGIISGKDTDYQSLSTMDSIIYNEYFTAEEVKYWRDKAMQELNPRSFIDTLKLIQKLTILIFFHPFLFVKKIYNKIKWL